MNWVRLNLAGFRSDKGAESYGYSDRMDVGPGDERHPVAYRWGSNLALGATYTASRPSSPESKNPDTDGRELTNGKIIPPTDYMTDKTIQPATAFWGAGERAVFIVDLGSNQPVAAVRVSTHQPNAQFCHPRSVAVELSTDAKTWDPAGTIQHEDLGIRPDYEAGSTTRLEKCGSSRRGRSPTLSPGAERQGIGAVRRFTCAPLDGKGLGLSELQVFGGVDVKPWPAEIWLPEVAANKR